MPRAELRKKLGRVPREPGIYLMKGARKELLYVGKAKDLRARLSSYFSETPQENIKTQLLLQRVVDFEVLLVRTEIEALLVERTLIKHHQPGA